VIGSLRRTLLGALRRRPEHAELPARSGRLARSAPRRASGAEADKRIEAARRRLKATIPPPPE
jgi:hypothetical protein